MISTNKFALSPRLTLFIHLVTSLHLAGFTLQSAVAQQDTVVLLSIEQYRQDVAEYSLALRSKQVGVESAEATISLKRVARLPQLLASGTYAHGVRQFEGFKSWNLLVEPQLIQTIYNGGVTNAEIEKALLDRDIAQCSADYTMLEVTYAADYAFWNLCSLKRYHAAMEHYAQLIRDEYSVIELRYKEGYIAKGDLLMISSRLSEVEFEVISAQQSMLIALYNLNILRGFDPEFAVDLTVDDLLGAALPSLPARVTCSEALLCRPDFRAAELTEQAAAATTRATRGAYNPKLYGGFSGAWRTFLFNTSGETYLDGYAFAEFSMPIFHFGERRKAVAVSRAAEAQSRLSRDVLHDSIISDEYSSWTKLLESRAQISTSSRSLEIASENLSISTFAYNEGEVSIVDLMQAQISWIQIYTNAINAEYNYRLALSAYHLAVGQPLLRSNY